MDILASEVCFSSSRLQDATPSTLKFDLVMSTMALFTGVLLGFSGYMIFSVYKLVKLRDIPMLLSVISVNLSLSCKKKCRHKF
jgi:hypothetical protein